MDKEIKKFLRTMVDEGKKKKDDKEQAIYKEQILVLELINEQRKLTRMFCETMSIWNKLFATETAKEYFSHRHNICNVIINPAISANISSVFVPDDDDRVRTLSKSHERAQRQKRNEVREEVKDIVKLTIPEDQEGADYWYDNYGVIMRAHEMLTSTELLMNSANGNPELEEQAADAVFVCLVNLYTYLHHFYQDCGYLSGMFMVEEPRSTRPIELLKVVKSSPFLRPKFFSTIYEYLAYQANVANMPSSLIEQGFPTNSGVRYQFTRTLNDAGNWSDLMRAIHEWSFALVSFTDELLSQVTLLMDKQTEPYFVNFDFER